MTTLAIAAGFYLANPTVWVMGSVVYGGATAAIVAVLLAWRVSRAARPGAGVAGLYLSTLERMAFVAAAFVLALAVLKLAPMAVLAGFFGAQVAYYVAAGMLRRMIRA